jgi:hypothetical protein
MVGHENILFAFVVRRHVYPFGANADEKQPHVRPVVAYFIKNIPAFDLACKRHDYHQWKYNKQENAKQDKRVNGKQYLYDLLEYVHEPGSL